MQYLPSVQKLPKLDDTPVLKGSYLYNEGEAPAHANTPKRYAKETRGHREKLKMYEITLSVPEETVQALRIAPENLSSDRAFGCSY